MDVDVELVRADNPSAFTLDGTNTWVVARDPAYVIDPGPALEAHIDAIVATVAARGGLGATLLTHNHRDHAEGAQLLLERAGGELASANGPRLLVHGDHIGPLRVYATPGHSADHLAYLYEGLCFTGDAVLGKGSVFVAPLPHAMSDYLASLAGLATLDLSVICPGHGPLVGEPRDKLAEYISHRLAREGQLVAALADGLRSVEDLLARVWSDAPSNLRVAAAVTLESHLCKLAEEGRLPNGVQRGRFQWLLEREV